MVQCRALFSESVCACVVAVVVGCVCLFFFWGGGGPLSGRLAGMARGMVGGIHPLYMKLAWQSLCLCRSQVSVGEDATKLDRGRASADVCTAPRQSGGASVAAPPLPATAVSFRGSCLHI